MACRFSGRVGVLLLGAAALPSTVAAQRVGDCWHRPAEPPADSARLRRALGLRVLHAAPLPGAAPVVDGRLDEPDWCIAEPAGDLVQSVPAPGRLATLPTVARVLYDDRAVYVAVRMFDPHPDSIVTPYPRRDDETTSDWVFVEVDTRFDHRSGYSFGVNPRGVQADGSWSNDVDYDPAWNGVWQAAAAVDSLGWTAEFRIPYSQVALGSGAPGAPLTWGFNIYRNIPHRGETANWSPRLPTTSGVVSRFSQLRGLVVPDRRAALELIPYGSLTATAPAAGGPQSGELQTRMGADLRLRPTASTAAALSIHPDFGQVEADPSRVNLTTFETFLPEQRPLFVEGADLLQLNSTLDFSSRGTSFAEERPFYSRRIGAPPHGQGLGGGPAPSSTTVLGAARLSGRSTSGWAGGLLNAWTGTEQVRYLDSTGASRRRQVEPATSYTVARVTRDLRAGDAAVGVLATAVNRFALSGGLDSVLTRRAYVVGADGRDRFDSGRYEASGFAQVSRVEGSAPAIALLRHQPRHGYGRPDRLGQVAPVERPHTTLSGVSAQARLARLEGALQWGLAGRVVSRGFEANDAGFQRNADWLLATLDWKYERFRPGRRVRRWSLGSTGTGIGWTTAGLRRAALVNLTATADLASYWGGSLGLNHEFPAWDPEVLRGGPSLLLPGRDGFTLGLYSDYRRAWQYTLDLDGAREAATGSRSLGISPGLSAFVTDRLQLGLSPRVGWDREGWQYVAQPEDSAGRTHYLLGRLRQTTVSLTARGTYAFTSRLTLQFYAQAFLSGGEYRGFSEVVAPGAAAAADRVQPIGSGRIVHDVAAGGYVVDPGTPGAFGFADPAFSERALHLNLLLRWEFLPGSTMFLVWSEERLDRGVAEFSWRRDLRRLFRAPAGNAVQLKVSYWLSR